jgi:hypothetical protein
MNEADQALVSDVGDCSRLLKYLEDSIPLGDHPSPHAEWVSVRLDVVQVAIDHIEWLEKGNEEWRQMYLAVNRQAKVAEATAGIAIGHLHAVLNKPRTHAEQQSADTAARDWLVSISSEPA